jgi:hypothetical protein
MSENNMKTKIIPYDTELLKKGFNEFIDKWEYQYNEKGEKIDGLLKEEYGSEENDHIERTKITQTEDDDSIYWTFFTEYTCGMKKRKKEVMEKPIDDTEEEEDSEELRKEKEHNLKYGVEITQHFPFPEFDSDVPQDDEDNKGNK